MDYTHKRAILRGKDHDQPSILVGTLFSDELDWEMSKITFFEFAKVSKSTKPRGAMVFFGHRKFQAMGLLGWHE